MVRSKSEFVAICPCLERAIQDIEEFFARLRELEEIYKEAGKIYDRMATSETPPEVKECEPGGPDASLDALPSLWGAWPKSSRKAAVSLRSAGWTVQAQGIDDAFRELPTGPIYSLYLEAYRHAVCEAAGRVKAILNTFLMEQGERNDDSYYSQIFSSQKSIENDIDLQRKFMEIAVREARKSVSEDGRIHPKVGVVIVKDGKELATAYRGELDQGEHAEYTALERKLVDEIVAGATVYTTLEPCTSRNHPKVPCADRLIERKIKQVVIGMLDPNPSISGKGYHRLRNATIAISLFDDDLKGQIEDLNREFIRQYKNASESVPSADRPAFSAALPVVRPEQKGSILMQWLVEEVFRPAVDIAQMLADNDWNPADVLSSKEYHESRDRLLAGLEHANKVLQELPRGEVQRAVQDLQMVTRDFETMFDSSTAQAIGHLLYVNGKSGWLALLHHLPPGVPAPPKGTLPYKRPKPPFHTASRTGETPVQFPKTSDTEIPPAAKTNHGEGTGGKTLQSKVPRAVEKGKAKSSIAQENTSQTTRWERLKKWALNNLLVVILASIGIVAIFLVSLISNLKTLIEWTRGFINWLWP